MTTTPILCRSLIPATMESAAPSPWTRAGASMISAGKRDADVVMISCMTAPFSEVTTPIVLGYRGRLLFRDCSKRPSDSRFFFRASKARYRSPTPAGLMLSTTNWYAPLWTYMSTDPKAETFMFSLGSKSILWRLWANITERISLPGSLSVK